MGGAWPSGSHQTREFVLPILFLFLFVYLVQSTFYHTLPIPHKCKACSNVLLVSPSCPSIDFWLVLDGSSKGENVQAPLILQDLYNACVYTYIYLYLSLSQWSILSSFVFLIFFHAMAEFPSFQEKSSWFLTNQVIVWLVLNQLVCGLVRSNSRLVKILLGSKSYNFENL